MRVWLTYLALTAVGPATAAWAQEQDTKEPAKTAVSVQVEPETIKLAESLRSASGW